MGFHVVLMSYRDTAHPEAGGAEVIMYEVFRRIRARGHRVTLITGAFPRGETRASIDGMDVHRVGNTFTFNFAGPLYYRRFIQKEAVDAVVEDINKIPFFTPLYSRAVPTLGVVPHLFGTTVFKQASLPIAAYVYLYERLIPIVYRRTRFSVLSSTTQDDLVRRGVSRERIHVIHAGIDLDAYPLRPSGHEPPGPVVTYLGRLKKYKAIELVILALPGLLERIPNARYRIVGEGDYLNDLKRIARRTGVAHAVEFLGHRVGREKLDILNQTRVLAYTSPKEGWGLSVIEAGAVGIPSLASDSPGLRESVRHGETGFVVPHGDVPAITEALVRLLGDDAEWARLSSGARAWAQRFSWDASADKTLELITRVIEEHGLGRGGQ